MRTINPGEIYRHFKGNLYQIVAVAYHSETREKHVVYQALYGDFKTYIRPYDMFLSEVDHDKYPQVQQSYRFEKLNPEVDLEASCIPHENLTQKALMMEPLDETALSSQDSICVSQTTETENMVGDSSKEQDSQEGVNPLLMDFFDQNTSAKRIEYLTKIHAQVDDRLINDIAASLDLTVEEGELEVRYQSLLFCLRTMARFECARFR